MEKKNYTLDELKNGVVLAARGGGVRSCVSIGVLKFLEENHIPVKCVCGESLSSMFAALVATGRNSEEIMEIFLKYNKLITRATPLLHGRGSVVIDEYVSKETDYKTFKEADIECYINACHGKLLKPQLMLFSKTATPDETFGVACRASASLPIYFGNYDTSVNGIGYSFFDGGAMFNPFIPLSNDPIIYSSFHNTFDYYKLSQLLQLPVDIATEVSDITIDTPVGGVWFTCSNDEMIRLADKGYEQAKKVLKP